MHNISAIVDRYKFISVDTEFPGVVVTPLQCARGNETSSYQWKTIRSNVNMYVSPCLFDINENVGLPACGHTTCSLMLRLKIIQLGITFADQHGNKPPGICTWQFNFHFDIKYVFVQLHLVNFVARAARFFSGKSRSSDKVTSC